MRATGFIVVVVALLTAGCESVPGVSSLFSDGEPDLLLVTAAGFCREGPTLVVALRNQGPTDAGDSTTRVVFSPGGEFRLATPGVGSGRIATLPPIDVPPQCFSPNCQLQVTLDVDDNVEEADEGNNTGSEICNAALAAR